MSPKSLSRPYKAISPPSNISIHHVAPQDSKSALFQLDPIVELFSSLQFSYIGRFLAFHITSPRHGQFSPVSHLRGMPPPQGGSDLLTGPLHLSRPLLPSLKSSQFLKHSLFGLKSIFLLSQILYEKIINGIIQHLIYFNRNLW